MVEEDTKEEEEGEEKMEDPGREEAGQQKLMVIVNPGETPPDHQSHLSVPLILLPPSVTHLKHSLPAGCVYQEDKTRKA